MWELRAKRQKLFQNQMGQHLGMNEHRHHRHIENHKSANMQLRETVFLCAFYASGWYNEMFATYHRKQLEKVLVFRYCWRYFAYSCICGPQYTLPGWSKCLHFTSATAAHSLLVLGRKSFSRVSLKNSRKKTKQNIKKA